MSNDSPVAIRATRGAILKEYEDGSLAVRILIAPIDKQEFMRSFPDVNLPVFIVRETQESAQKALQEEAVTYGTFARDLKLHSDWMGNPKVWQALGTDDEYLEWCREQPCAHCDQPPHWEMDVYVRSEAAHVRRVANGSGTAIKPPYSAIPLCPPDHKKQHQHGESWLGGKEAVDAMRIESVKAWAWKRMRTIFSVESMREVAPDVLLAWARSKGIDKHLPACYRREAA